MSRAAPTVLIVDDEPRARRLLAMLLRPEGYRTESVASGEAALRAVARAAPDLILLDIMMPGLDGYDVASILKADPATANIPIIMVSAHGERGSRLAGLSAGAEDFLTKPIDRAELWLRVRNLLRLTAFGVVQEPSLVLQQQVAARTADLRRFRSAIDASADAIMLVGREMRHQASHDALTGLPNRNAFYEALRSTTALAVQQGSKVAVMFIDLDHFKNVNDTLGHAAGDALLAEFGDRLGGCVRARDTVGRLGGDEFGLILVMEHSHAGAAKVAAKVAEALHRPFNLRGGEVGMTASIGIAIHPDDGGDGDALLKYADTALCQAKLAGRNTYRFFTAQMNVDVLRRQDLEGALRKAIGREEFELYYQPKVALASGAIVGMEALLRWNRPGHGQVAPGLFIPALEESGLIVQVGGWVIGAACRQIRAWQLDGTGPVQVSVNVSGRQFVEGDLEADVTRALAGNDVAPGLLELELTETSLMANTERTIACLSSLRRRGVKVSIDDFGTGYSSLAYLRRFPVDKLKIDIAFIRDVASNPDDAAIVRAIITMAHSLNLVVVAEGVETPAQRGYLLRQGCDQIQGYLVSRPLPAARMTELMALGATVAHAPAAERPDAGRRTLLIVDDDPFTLALLAAELGPEQYHILQAQSGAEAFDLLAQHEVQVILCDHSMPDMQGTVVLDRVRTMYPDTFRIILSGRANLEEMMAAVNLGVVDRFYTKPWSHEALLESVRQAFVGGESRSSGHSPDRRLPNEMA